MQRPYWNNTATCAKCVAFPFLYTEEAIGIVHVRMLTNMAIYGIYTDFHSSTQGCKGQVHLSACGVAYITLYHYMVWIARQGGTSHSQYLHYPIYLHSIWLHACTMYHTSTVDITSKHLSIKKPWKCSGQGSKMAVGVKYSLSPLPAAIKVQSNKEGEIKVRLQLSVTKGEVEGEWEVIRIRATMPTLTDTITCQIKVLLH